MESENYFVSIFGSWNELNIDYNIEDTDDEDVDDTIPNDKTEIESSDSTLNDPNSDPFDNTEDSNYNGKVVEFDNSDF